MKINFWELMSLKDDYIFELINFGFRLKYFFNFNQRSLLSANLLYKGKGVGRDTYIILNGPSLQEQDLSALKGKSLMFVNRGFKHPLYSELQPEFHVIVDPKLKTGEWPITWLDEILEMAPNVVLVLDANWASLEKFKPYREKASILWINQQLYWSRIYSSDIDICKPFKGFAVFGACFHLAAYMGFDKIFFTGFDANGLAYEMLKQDSHFYGINDENNLKTTREFSRDLYMMHRGLRTLNLVADYCKGKGIAVINLTKGGLLDMFDRQQFPEVYSEKVN